MSEQFDLDMLRRADRDIRRRSKTGWVSVAKQRDGLSTGGGLNFGEVKWIYDECNTPEFKRYLKRKKFKQGLEYLHDLLTKKEKKMNSDFSVEIDNLSCRARCLCEQLEDVVDMFEKAEHPKLTRTDKAKLDSLRAIFHEIDALKADVVEWKKKKSGNI